MLADRLTQAKQAARRLGAELRHNELAQALHDGMMDPPPPGGQGQDVKRNLVLKYAETHLWPPAKDE
eukprot:8860451-Alexandrium_andersonii.AAC.1